ncbi:class I SAM-dependent methyltransferase [Oscillatoria laete-virens NRMC-F 0139]|nr:class I SAM-dependent methyltransferase [Oscillatoria laete-virens]MDL5054709.1 class I SAM-dependent methyltransferase [Oscillatoria laete-virens NRMC-F 0139]
MPKTLFEDGDFLAVEKPAGVSSHRVAELAPEGFYEYLCRRLEMPNLGMHQRLDRDTSGVMLFAKTDRANQTLSAQFAAGRVCKTYHFLSASRSAKDSWTCTEPVGGRAATTDFAFVGEKNGVHAYMARPRTGRTHQIRQHARAANCAILGDTAYGGAPAPRMFLHAAKLEFLHPVTGQMTLVESPLPSAFSEPTRARVAADFAACLFDSGVTNAWRMPVWSRAREPKRSVDFYKQFALVSSESEPQADQKLFDELAPLGVLSMAHKLLDRKVRGRAICPTHLAGEVMNDDFFIRENGLRYLVSFKEGYSTGLFLDQRENRFDLRRWCGHHPGAEVLNVFSYTCAFSVSAAAAGARTTSLDLSTKYLDWGKKNFAANKLPLDGHDFIFGDAFDWMRRLAKKGRKFDCVILDPPTFSTNKDGKVFRADKNYGELAALALKLLKRPGVLFCSANMATLKPLDFERALKVEIQKAGRKIRHQHFQAEPFDFLVPGSPAFYLKTFWFDLQ